MAGVAKTKAQGEGVGGKFKLSKREARELIEPHEQGCS